MRHRIYLRKRAIKLAELKEAQGVAKKVRICSIWVFPKIMVPPNHPFVHRVFHEINHPFWDTPIFGNTHFIVFHINFDDVRRKSRGGFLQILRWWERDPGSVTRISPEMNQLNPTMEQTLQTGERNPHHS